MRIALVARGCRPGSGIERYTYETALRLSQRHEVSVITQPEEYEPCGLARLVPIHVPPAPHWHSILNFSHRAGVAAQAGRYDLVHTQGSDATWGDVVTAHSCHWAGMRASLKVHPTWVNHVRKALSPAHRAILHLESGVFAGAKQLVAVSHRVKRQVLAAYPETRNIPLEVISPGVEPRSFSPERIRRWRLTVRALLGVKPDQVVFALAANALRLKGAERLIRAVARTRSQSSVLLLASSARPDAALKSLARSLGAAERVKFLPVEKNIEYVLAAADAYALLPEYESFGLTVLEAASAGLPLLLAQNVGAAELFRSGRDAVMLPALADAESLARALDTLATQPQTRRRLGASARRMVKGHTWDQMVGALEAVFQKCRRLDAKRKA